MHGGALAEPDYSRVAADILESPNDSDVFNYDNDEPPLSSSDEQYVDNEETNRSLQDDLAQWVVDAKLTRESCNGQLALLRKHGCQLPKDRRTLLKTPRTVTSQQKCGVEYIYFGLNKILRMTLNRS